MGRKKKKKPKPKVCNEKKFSDQSEWLYRVKTLSRFRRTWDCGDFRQLCRESKGHDCKRAQREFYRLCAKLVKMKSPGISVEERKLRTLVIWDKFAFRQWINGQLWELAKKLKVQYLLGG